MPDNIYLTLIIISIVELFNRLRGRDLWAAVSIIVSATVGFVFGLFHYAGFDPVTGISAGLMASGLIRAISAAKSAVVPSRPF